MFLTYLTSDVGKNLSLLRNFKMSPIFFSRTRIFKIGGAWEQNFAIFSDFAGSRKNRAQNRGGASEAQHRDVVAPALVLRPTLAVLALPIPASFLLEGAL